MNDTETTLKEMQSKAVSETITTGDENWRWLLTLTTKKLNELKAHKKYEAREVVTR
ncbi:hypothetical protein PQ472_07965 [Lacticaseibacillus pabuli]|uniref:Uncharacterized protein n=1 Tax=Lacticaseibacillus pabuli TaxID=3025672 RepID=A0ABY7WSC5_9LACO|nr:hypothetical protein [Lacticaseibacillus sp. KACC 23028]WDF81861.1 hypothetical protein PQ472_07965 [Lacticaseibacillus sp. KACC 23028]